MNDAKTPASAAIAEQAAASRDELARFLDDSRHSFEFRVPCGPEERIDYIYSIVLPGWRKVRFYRDFLLCRLAKAVDYSPIKVLLYRLAGFRIGRGVFISPDVLLDPHFPSLIEIGDHAIIGWGTHLFAHEFDGRRYRLGRIRVGAGAVLGAFCVVRGGVTIGENASIPSTYIVFRDVPANCNPGGGEARFSRTLLRAFREERSAEHPV